MRVMLLNNTSTLYRVRWVQFAMLYLLNARCVHAVIAMLLHLTLHCTVIITMGLSVPAIASG